MNTSRSDPDNLKPYRIHSEKEIVFFLESVRQQRQLIRMIFSEGRESVLTSFLDIDTDHHVMYIDAAPNPAQNRRIMLTQKVLFETTLDRIRIMFNASGAQHCEHNGFPALRFPIPPSLVRIQRRQSFRMTVPSSDPIRCLFMPPGTEMQPLTAPTTLNLRNISTGGIAVIDTGYLLDGRPGAVYPTCQIAFPGSPVTVGLEVRYAQIIALPNGKAGRQIGMRFVETPDQVIALIQRYVMKLEREQNAKSIGAS